MHQSTIADPSPSVAPPRSSGRTALLAWRAARRQARRADPTPIVAPPLPTATEQVVQTSAGPVRVREVGEGPPILFVHGLLVDGQVWNATASALAARYRCVIPDLPLGSHSRPMLPGADLSPTGIARLLGELVDLLDLTDVTVVANDSGGAITQLWMADGARGVARVVLATVDAFDNFPPAAFRIYPLLAKSPAALKAVLGSTRFKPVRHQPLAYGLLTHRAIDDSLAKAWLRPSKAQAGVGRDLRAFLLGLDPGALIEAEPRIASFDRPVLLAWAPEQRWFPIEHADRLAALLPDARVVEIEGSGAFPQLDQPERLAGAVDAFVSST